MLLFSALLRMLVTQRTILSEDDGVAAVGPAAWRA
jgi:hypothetical protein